MTMAGVTSGAVRALALLGTMAFATMIAPTPAAAQSLSLGRNTGNQPIEIVARDGIEWHRDSQRYIARGEARATQGSTVVDANVLTAYYRDKKEGGTEIFRFEGEGRVRITTPAQNAVGDQAIYDIDSGVLVMTGRNLKLTTPNETITARDSLEYWEAKRLAVARGDALVVSQDKRLKADVVAAYFVEVAAGAPPAAIRTPASRGGPAQPTSRAQPTPPPAQPVSTGAPGERNRLQRIEAFGNVLVSTPSEVIRGDRGIYNADTGIATLASHVRITRGKSQLNGDYAEVDLNTGVSRLLARPKAGGDGRVRGLFVPEPKAGGGGAAETKTPAR